VNRFQLASDIRDLVRVCLGDDCEYRLVIARGRPTIECDLVAFWFGDQVLDRTGGCEDSFCDLQQELRLNVMIARLCYSPTGNVNVDYAAEEDAALCFYRDLELLECCLDDNAGLLQVKRDHSLDSIARVRTVMAPDSNDGGAIAARIEFVLKGELCCDESS